jgi:hypothetical protein
VTLERWLVARDPAPPPSLALRLRAVLGEMAPAERDGPAAEACARAGERLLAQLLREGCASRDSALDLLAADALVTYAFEAACVEPALLERRAQEAMARIAALAGDRTA